MASIQKRRLLVVGLLTCITLITGCDSGGSNQRGDFDYPVHLGQEWTEASAGDVGLSANQLDLAVKAARNIERLQSLLVVKDGRLVVEEYLHGAESDDLFDVRSVTKSIISTLIGIALSEGVIPSLEEPASTRLSHLMGEVISEGNQAVTVQDLLTMTGGWQYDEWNSDSYQQWLASPNPDAWVFQQPRVADSGTLFTYNSAAVHALGLLLDAYAPESMIQYADSRLFRNIGIVERNWEMLSTDHANGGAGIDLNARDLARFGQLYLQNGVSGDTQVLPAEWVAQSTTPKHAFRNSFGPLREMSYGYLWWTDDNGGDPFYFAWGYGGQFVLVWPSQRMVVVTTTDYSGVGSESGGESALSRAVMAVIVNQVMPAAR